MFSHLNHSTNTAWFFSVLIAALVFSLFLSGVAAAQTNTSLGTAALQNNTTGHANTASGVDAPFGNTPGDNLFPASPERLVKIIRDRP